MITIRPVSDLRNKFTEIEDCVKSGKPVYLTKNGYGSMVVLSLEQYAALTDDIELKLDEADKAAAADPVRYTEDEVFSRVRSRIHERKALYKRFDPSVFSELQTRQKEVEGHSATDGSKGRYAIPFR